MQIKPVDEFLSSTKIEANIKSPPTNKAPFFLLVGDDHYYEAKNKLGELDLDLEFVRVSDYCNELDKIPDIDRLLDYLKKPCDVPSRKAKIVVLGLGEYIALHESKEVSNFISQFKDLNVGCKKVVFLLRGISSQLKFLQNDPRFASNRYLLLGDGNFDISLTLINPSIGIPTPLKGIKDLLVAFEEGKSGNLVVNTRLDFNSELISIKKIDDPYDGIKVLIPDFSLPRSCGNDSQWAELLFELSERSNSLDAVLRKKGFSVNLETDFNLHIDGLNYTDWVYYIALKCRIDEILDSYLRLVLEKTNTFEEFKKNLLNLIIDIPHTNNNFEILYAERKRLIEKFSESDIADFVVNSRKNNAESIHLLTDNTLPEREEIIAWISQNGYISEINAKYPALSSYLKKYIFDCGELSEQLTEYFEAYKRQKVSNKLEDSFIEQVETLALSRQYNRLQSRNEIIDKLDEDETFLLWVDALGVEYLAYISELVEKRGLSISVHIVRAVLPTITECNRDFYDNWKGKKEKNNKLDNIKHKEEGGYNFSNNKLPIHLVKELEVISQVVEKAATCLAQRKYKTYAIASDHGASRLAVLRNKDVIYQSDSKGEHSGRCCLLTEAFDLPNASQENGYLVLADYGRFKGSRAANVEVHGGASLEEVIVPIIELKLKDTTIKVQIVENSVIVDFKNGAEINIFSNTKLKKASIILNGKRYNAIRTDDNHYKVLLPELKRAGEYSADIYEGDTLIGKIHINAQGKTGKINEAFEDLF